MFHKLLFVFLFTLAAAVLPALSIYLPEGFNRGEPIVRVTPGFQLPTLAMQTRRSLSDSEVHEVLMKRFIDLHCTPAFAGTPLPSECSTPRFRTIGNYPGALVHAVAL